MNAFCVSAVIKALKNSVFDPKLDEPNDTSVADICAQNFKQFFVIDIFKEIFDVGFDGKAENLKKIASAKDRVSIGFAVSISIRAV